MSIIRAIYQFGDKLTKTETELIFKEVLGSKNGAIPNKLLYSLADKTYHPSECPVIMKQLWKVIELKSNLQELTNALVLAEYLCKFGSSRSITELKDKLFLIQNLGSISNSAKASIIKEKSKYVSDLLSDFSKLEQERHLARLHRSKIVGFSSQSIKSRNETPVKKPVKSTPALEYSLKTPKKEDSKQNKRIFKVEKKESEEQIPQPQRNGAPEIPGPWATRKNFSVQNTPNLKNHGTETQSRTPQSFDVRQTQVGRLKKFRHNMVQETPGQRKKTLEKYLLNLNNM